MLIYHPLKDPNHCTYRMLCILYDMDTSISYDLLKLLDFYILFPHLLKTIRLPKYLLSDKKILNKVQEPYENLPLPSKILFELSSLQNSCIDSFLTKGIIDKEEFENGKIRLNSKKLDLELLNLITNNCYKKEAWYIFLLEKLSKIYFNGKDGLKDRTKMMEYIYDSV